jgi:hypothetical protein
VENKRVQWIKIKILKYQEQPCVMCFVCCQQLVWYSPKAVDDRRYANNYASLLNSQNYWGWIEEPLLTWCKRCMINSCSSSLRLTSHANGALNHSSKFPDELKILGRMKLSNDHSSCRLFWIGVPVKSSLRRIWYLQKKISNLHQIIKRSKQIVFQSSRMKRKVKGNH